VWQLAPGAKLVDVRTRAEWDWVGRIPGAVEIEWHELPRQQAEPPFPGATQATGRSRSAADVHLPQRRAFAQCGRTGQPGKRRPIATTCSRASRATRTPTASAARSEAGGTPACPGVAELFAREPGLGSVRLPRVSEYPNMPSATITSTNSTSCRTTPVISAFALPANGSATRPYCSATTTSAPTSISTPTSPATR
jgi:rhodanese-related sulfurtransferase